MFFPRSLSPPFKSRCVLFGVRYPTWSPITNYSSHNLRMCVRPTLRFSLQVPACDFRCRFTADARIPAVSHNWLRNAQFTRIASFVRRQALCFSSVICKCCEAIRDRQEGRVIIVQAMRLELEFGAPNCLMQENGRSRLSIQPSWRHAGFGTTGKIEASNAFGGSNFPLRLVFAATDLMTLISLAAVFAAPFVNCQPLGLIG